MRTWIIALVVLVIIGTGSSLFAFLKHSEEQQTVGSYIVQAANLDQARTAVIEAGGEVTHELDIIRSVGATLTRDQLKAVRARSDVKRVYEDRAVSTSHGLSALSAANCGFSASDRLGFDGSNIVWRVTNTSGNTLHLDRMMVMWPKRGGVLRSIDVGQRRIFDGKIKGITASFDAKELLATTDSDDDSDRRPLPDRIAIAAGATLDVAVEFDHTVEHEDSYEIRLFFKEGCRFGFPLAANRAFEGDSDTAAQRTFVASLVGADALHSIGITGRGVGIAVIDTGIWTKGDQSRYLLTGAHGQQRIVAQYDAISNTVKKNDHHSDENGHGTHVTSLIASSRRKDNEFNGIAPGAHLAVIRAFDKEGTGTYLDVIRGLDWVLKHKDVYRIRVLNLSFSATPQSYYWDDPLNQAVMAAWQNGIAVVASAGNDGPAPMTIGVPGNLPYVITVGAMTDSVTPLDWSDDRLASFSAAGPTYEAFVKPDVVAPGGHVRGLMDADSKFATNHPHYHDGDAYFTMSGTSPSAAIVSGAVALLLQVRPWLLPDHVKCKLVSTARAASESDGTTAYSVFQQGAGLIDISAALRSWNYGCANVGLDVSADLAGSAHFRGPVEQDANGVYYLGNQSDNRWDGSADFDHGYAWSGGMAWNDGMPWNDSQIFSGGLPWNDAKLWNDGMPWNDVNKLSISVNTWVKQE
ncbi:MAG: S8 family peptidase [Gammaproteobacteria bacterium]|nr:S8 family peptidase [Gammaproteobacteria bacterium]